MSRLFSLYIHLNNISPVERIEGDQEEEDDDEEKKNTPVTTIK